MELFMAVVEVITSAVPVLISHTNLLPEDGTTVGWVLLGMNGLIVAT